jgi:hypothetical protein
MCDGRGPDIEFDMIVGAGAARSGSKKRRMRRSDLARFYATPSKVRENGDARKIPDCNCRNCQQRPSSVIATTVLVQSLSTSSAQTAGKSRYLPEYTADGDLILPKNFHEWVFVGSPLTPNARG